MKHGAPEVAARPNARLTILWLTLLALCAGQAAAQATKASEAPKSATQKAKELQSVTGAKPPRSTLPVGDPCAILPLADVQKAFPGAKAGERSTRLEEYGMTECAWKDSGGRVVLVAQESYNSGANAKEDALGMAQGFTDPLNPKALKNVRIETFAGIGSDAAAFVETADPARGILSDGALLELRRGQHNISLGSAELPRRDRAAALKAFEELGRVASRRLQ